MEGATRRGTAEGGPTNGTLLRRILAVAEVLAVVAGAAFVWLLVSRLTPAKGWERKWFGGWFVLKILLLTVLPMGLLVATRRSLGRHGISFHGLRYQVGIGLLAMAVVLPASFSFGVLLWLGIGFAEWRGALILAPVELAATMGVGLLLRRQPTRKEHRRGSGVGVYLAVLATVTVLSAATRGLVPQVSRFAGQFFVTGFGEEIMFRGYVQSRLNHSFGRPWRLFGTAVGPGLVIASILFGLIHWAQSGGTVWWALWTTCSGLLLGFLREKTGGIVAPGIVHGLPQAIGVLVSPGI